MLAKMLNVLDAESMAIVNQSTHALSAIFIGGVARGILLAFIYERWGHIRSFLGGAMAGAIIGFLIMVSADLIALSPTGLTTSFFAFDIIAGTILFALSGGVIGWFLGYHRKTESDEAVKTPRYF